MNSLLVQIFSEKVQDELAILGGGHGASLALKFTRFHTPVIRSCHSFRLLKSSAQKLEILTIREFFPYDEFPKNEMQFT